MKIRNGFVTNSSSSSFIIGFKDGVTLDNLIYKEIDKLSWPMQNIALLAVKKCQTLEENFDYEIKTVEELRNHIYNSYGGWGDESVDDILDRDNYAKNLHDRYVQLIKEGYVCRVYNVDDHDEDIWEFINAISDGDNIINLGVIDW
jgi:hypothetical protein